MFSVPTAFFFWRRWINWNTVFECGRLKWIRWCSGWRVWIEVSQAGSWLQSWCQARLMGMVVGDPEEWGGSARYSPSHLFSRTPSPGAVGLDLRWEGTRRGTLGTCSSWRMSVLSLLLAGGSGGSVALIESWALLLTLQIVLMAFCWSSPLPFNVQYRNHLFYFW